jgi:hypothetical protein
VIANKYTNNRNTSLPEDIISIAHLLNTPADGFEKGGSGNGKPHKKTHQDATAHQRGTGTNLARGRTPPSSKDWYFPKPKNPTNKSGERSEAAY